jgi:amino acid transporter
VALGRLSPALGALPVAVGVIVIAAGVIWNLAGASAVGGGSAVMTGLLLTPFAVLVALTISGHATPPLASAAAEGATALGSARAPGAGPSAPDLAGGVLVAMWNYMGWDNGSTFAGEVDRPQRTYPIAVLAAVALIALTYVVPMSAMLAAGVDSSSWDTGAWVDVARAYGGSALAAAVVLGGMVSAFGMFNALCLSYSRLPAVLAADGYLPRVFARVSRAGVPWVAVLACALAWTLSLGLSFERLVSLDVLLYGGSLVLEFAALVVLRVREPDLPRPFRVPGGIVGAALLGVGPVVLLCFALVKNADERLAGMNALVAAGGLVLLGPVAYAATTRLRFGASARE